MKTTIITTICLLWLYLAGLQAQDDVYYTPEKKTGKQPEQQNPASNDSIHTGFVFIDGKYIDAPYKVERCNDLGICINGIEVVKPLEWPEVNKEAFDHHPGYPKVDKYATFREAAKVKEPTQNGSYITAATRYYYTHFEFEKASQKVETYIKNLPYVKSFEKVQDEADTWIIENYAGETQRGSFANHTARWISEKWGPHGSGARSKASMIEGVNTEIELFENGLQRKQLYLFFTDKNKYLYFYEDSMRKLKGVQRIMNSNMSEAAKVDSLLSLKVFNEYNLDQAVIFVNKFESSGQLERRLHELEKSKEKEHEFIKKKPEDTLNDLNHNAFPQNKNKLIKSIDQPDSDTEKSISSQTVSYSPDGGVVYAACPYTKDPAFVDFQQEVTALSAVINSGQNIALGAPSNQGGGNISVKIFGDLEVCHKIRVVSNEWCDFVFSNGYARPSLNEKRCYYEQNNHLIGLPSENDILENGIDIKEVLLGVTKNLEENSLDIIDNYDNNMKQNERLHSLERENTECKSIIKNLISENSKLVEDNELIMKKLLLIEQALLISNINQDEK